MHTYFSVNSRTGEVKDKYGRSITYELKPFDSPMDETIVFEYIDNLYLLQIGVLNLI